MTIRMPSLVSGQVSVRRPAVRTSVLYGSIVLLSACSGLTKVSAPDITQPAAFENAAGALARRAGAIAQFYSDFAQWALPSGVVSDEFSAAVRSDLSFIDQRLLPDGAAGATSWFGTTYPGPRTRVNALTAIGLLKQYASQPAARIGELFASIGTIQTVMAEGLCSGVTLATVTNGVPAPGPHTTTAQLYADALAQFDSAARYAADSAPILNWVAVGRARALLDLDSSAQAAGAVAMVPTSYVQQAQFSATVHQPNVIAQQMSFGAVAVSDREGLTGLNFVSAKDPRIPTDSLGLGQDNFTPLYGFVPYSSLGAPMAVASGIEARLIEAEAALKSGDAATWIADLNALRADSADTHVTGLGPIADPVTPTAQIDTMFTERAFWLFATGHRQGDLRRLIRQYGRMQAQVFPTGLYKNTGQQYGSDITFPIIGDNANPSLPECLDRNP